MTTLHLVTDAGGRSGSASARRPVSRTRPKLQLVADTGSAYRSPASSVAPPRRHSFLTLAVAAAAIAAAALTASAFEAGGEPGGPAVAPTVADRL